MTAHRTAPARRYGDRDDGAATLWMVFGTVIVFAVCGLVFDGGALINAKSAAINDAEAAARAGAQGLDITAIYATGSDRRLDPGQAEYRAQQFLTAQGWTGTVHATPTEVTVTVTRTQDLTFLHMFGVTDRTVTGTATARPENGLADP